MSRLLQELERLCATLGKSSAKSGKKTRATRGNGRQRRKAAKKKRGNPEKPKDPGYVLAPSYSFSIHSGNSVVDVVPADRRRQAGAPYGVYGADGGFSDTSIDSGEIFVDSSCEMDVYDSEGDLIYSGGNVYGSRIYHRDDYTDVYSEGDSLYSEDISESDSFSFEGGSGVYLGGSEGDSEGGSGEEDLEGGSGGEIRIDSVYSSDSEEYYSEGYGCQQVASELISVDSCDRLHVLEAPGSRCELPAIFPSAVFAPDQLPRSTPGITASDVRLAYAGASTFVEEYSDSCSEHSQDGIESQNGTPCVQDNSYVDVAVELASYISHEAGELDEDAQFDMYTRYQNHFGWDFPLCEEWVQRIKEMEIPAILSNHHEYRRFRYYDLVRVKLNNNEHVDLQPFVDSRVRFNITLKKHFFGGKQLGQEGKGEPVKDERTADGAMVFGDETEVGERRVQCAGAPASILMVKKAPPRERAAPVKIQFLRTDVERRLKSRLGALETAVAEGARLEPGQMDVLKALAHEHASEFVENILRAFEGISCTGKRLISLINRLQALANRYMVLSDDAFRQSLVDVSLSKLLSALLSDCTQLAEEIGEFQGAFGRARAYMQAHLGGLVAHANECLDVSDRCHNIVQAASVHEVATHLPEREADQYTRYINFLHNLKAKRIFRFLVGDFDKMHANTRVLFDACQALVLEAQVSYREVSVFQ